MRMGRPLCWPRSQKWPNFSYPLLQVGDQLQNRDAHVFTTIDQNDGLPSNDVRDVAFAPSGDRWFGTTAGVARDDGTDIVSFDDGDGLPSDSVRQLAIDSVVIDGAVREVCWVATQAGLGRIDADIGSVVGLRAIDGLPSVDLRSVAVDGQHRKYVGHGTPSGAFRYDGL
jgi:ligand-binding sensor domain-containing protein